MFVGRIVAAVLVALVLYFLVKQVRRSSFAAVTDLSGYNIAQGIDFTGNDIKKLTDVTPAQCKTECDNNTACVGFTMNESSKTCALKSAKANLDYPGDKAWFDKIKITSMWSDEPDGAKPLPQVLVDNKLATYATDANLKNKILARLADVTQRFADWLKYFKDANAGGRTDLTYEIANRMISARILMFGLASVADPDGTRSTRVSIVPPNDLSGSGLTRLSFNGKLYGFTIDQLMPYSTKSTGVSGVFPAETLDDAINEALYRCKVGGKNCNVVVPQRCDTVNEPSKGTPTELAQCDTSSLYATYAELERQFNTYMARVKANTSSIGTSMTSSWCSTNDVLWGTTVGNEVMMCPRTHMRFSTNADKCVKNDVSYNGGKYTNCTSCRTGYRRGNGCDCVLNADSTRAPCAKYYKSFVAGSQFYTADRAGQDVYAWAPIGGPTEPTKIPGRLVHPNVTSIPVWGRA